MGGHVRAAKGGRDVLLAWCVPMIALWEEEHGGSRIPESEPSYEVITLSLRIPRESLSCNPVLEVTLTHPNPSTP